MPKLWGVGICARAALLAGLLATAVMPLPATASEPTRGGSLTFVWTRFPNVLITSIEPSAGVAVVASKMLEGLMFLDAKGNVVPTLATEWTAAPGGKEFTFKLRPNVKWHDGKPFTSADVAFTMEQVWKLFLKNPAFSAISSIETPDPLTLVLKLSNPIPADLMFSVLADGRAQVLPKHIYEGKDIRSNPANTRPVGTGPFRFKSRETNQFILLERNPDYWDPKLPYLDQMVFRILPDSGSMAAALEAGQVHIVPQTLLGFGDVSRFKTMPGFAVTAGGYESYGWITPLIFNLHNPILANRDVRLAIRHAIDLSVVANTAYQGHARPATSPYLQTFKYYNPNVSKYDFNPAKARELLDKAGYPVKGAHRFQLRFLVAPFTEGTRSSGDYIRQALAAVGIDATIQASDAGAFIRRTYRDYDFDLAIGAATTGLDPLVPTSNHYWSKAIDKVAFHNAARYSNPAMDRVIEALTQELDPAKRMQLAHELQRIGMEDLPWIPLAEIDQITVYSTQVQNVASNPIWIWSSWADLWIKK